MRSILAAVAAVLALVGLPGPAASAAETCAALYDEIKSGGAQQDVDSLKSFYDRSLATGDCTDAFKKALGRRVAVAIARAADAAIASGEPPASQEEALVESLAFHRLWQVLAVLGDIAHGRQDFTNATLRYQQSLEALADPALTKSAPDRATIAIIFKKAETSRLLAPRYVATPNNSAGIPTGLGAAEVRGFEPVRVALPIAFEDGSLDLTPQSKRAVSDMSRQLTRHGSPGIRIVGHAATAGDAAGNQLLSEQRAHAARQALIDAGYTGAVQTQGHGDRRPFEPDDPSRYTEEQRNRMNTRLELHR